MIVESILRNNWLPAYVLLCIVVSAPVNDAVAETGRRATPEQVTRGAALYRTHCTACHKANGVGEAPIPWSIRRPGFVNAMPLDETSHAWHHGDRQLIAMIMDGTGNSRARMPRWRGILTEKDAADLVGYIKNLWSDRIVACQGPAHMSCM